MIRVFILHWNRPVECLRTVMSFREQKDVLLRLTIIDNGSRSDLLNDLETVLPKDVEIVRLSQNHGWGAAFNRVLRTWAFDGHEEYCCISAHDAILRPDCLKLLREICEKDPAVGIATPQFEDNLFAHFSPIRGLTFARGLAKLRGVAEPMIIPHGTLSLFRKRFFIDAGFYDERFFAYGDEAEIGLRAWLFGWKVLHVWGATIVNPGSWTPGPLMNYLTARNSLLLAWKYGGVTGILGRLAVLVVSMARLALRPEQAWMNYSPAAQIRGIRDFFHRRFGKPRWLK